MAPKLPPPANTKAVFAGLTWLGTDKPRSLPGIDARTISHATFGRIYSSPRAHVAINNVCCVGGDRNRGISARNGPAAQRRTGATPHTGQEDQRSTNAFSI